MKALVGAFNQEKALVGAFSVIVQLVVEPMEHYTARLMPRPCSQDLREQADRVQQSLTDRVAETEEATRKLETNLKKTVDEIAQVGLRISCANIDGDSCSKRIPCRCRVAVLWSKVQRFLLSTRREYFQLRFYLHLMEKIM